MEGDKRMKNLLIYSLLYITDGITTNIGLSKGIKELNPFYSLTGKIIMFFILLAVFYVGLKSVNKFTNKVTKYSLFISNILLMVIIINNIIVIGGLK